MESIKSKSRQFYRDTYASMERRIGKRARLEKAVLVLFDSVTDLLGRIDLWYRAVQRRKRVELGNRHGMTDPIEELLVRHDPD